MSPARLSAGLALATTFCALVYDPRAEAADPKRFFSLVLAVLGVSTWIARPVCSRAPDWAARAALAFLAFSALSLCWGLAAGGRELGTLCAALGTGCLARQLGPSGARRAARLSALAIGGIGACVVIVEALHGASRLELHAGQGNPNWLGLLLAATLPLSLDAALAFRRATLAARVATWAASLSQLPALYLSHSRVAWLAAGLSGVGFLLLSTRRPALRRLLLLPFAATLILVASSDVRSTGDVAFGDALRGRAWIWQHSARAAWRALPFGEGLGRFGYAYLDAQGEALASLTPGQAARRFTNATTAHDDYLQAALDSGPLATASLAIGLLLGVRNQVRRRWLGGAAALLACAITAVGDSPLRQPGVVLLVGLLLGSSHPARRHVPRPTVKTWLALGSLVLLAFSAQQALRSWLGTRERLLARDAEPREQFVRLTRAARLDPASGETQLELGLLRLRMGDTHRARVALVRADASFADTATRLAIGEAELEASHTAAAEHAFARALAWNFGSFRARLGLSRVQLRQGRLDQAEREALIAHKLLPGDPRARELLDAIREAKMDRGY